MVSRTIQWTLSIARRVLPVVCLTASMIPAVAFAQDTAPAQAPAAAGAAKNPGDGGPPPIGSADTTAAPGMPAGPGNTAVPAPVTPAGTPTVVASAERKALCERYVGVLSGATKDAALLKNPEVQKLAQAVPDLPSCGAVAHDAEALCDVFVLPPKQGGSKGDNRSGCRKSWSLYHELRNPKGRSYIMNDANYQECKSSKEFSQYCDAVREAAQAGNPNKCPKGGLECLCRAFVGLDASQCCAQSPISIQECQQQVAQYKSYSGGLKALANAKVQENERPYVDAALGNADACAAYAQAAKDLCLAAESAATAPKATAAKEKAPETPAPKPADAK